MHIRNVLALLALPAGIIGYMLGAALIGAIPVPDPVHGFLVAFGPLLVAGLCAMPFVIPFFDHMAKRDLANAPGRQGGLEGRTSDPEGRQGGLEGRTPDPDARTRDPKRHTPDPKRRRGA